MNRTDIAVFKSKIKIDGERISTPQGQAALHNITKPIYLYLYIDDDDSQDLSMLYHLPIYNISGSISQIKKLHKHFTIQKYNLLGNIVTLEDFIWVNSLTFKGELLMGINYIPELTKEHFVNENVYYTFGHRRHSFVRLIYANSKIISFHNYHQTELYNVVFNMNTIVTKLVIHSDVVKPSNIDLLVEIINHAPLTELKFVIFCTVIISKILSGLTNPHITTIFISVDDGEYIPADLLLKNPNITSLTLKGQIKYSSKAVQENVTLRYFNNGVGPQDIIDQVAENKRIYDNIRFVRTKVASSNE